MEFRAGMSSTVSVLLLLLLTLRAGPTWAASWSYEGRSGPHYWHELFPQACSGKYQSPIDIRVERTLFNPDLRDFAIWFDPPQPGSAMTVLNNGHTVQVVTSGQFYVTNGGLPNVYKTAQFHFHWGHAQHHGSEHTIDGRAFPLELHIVNYNSDLYDNIGAAVTEKQGLAVLGVMFEITDEDNEEFEPIIAAMEEVQDPEDGRQVEIKPLSLRRLLPHDITDYYRYNGSLTTPGCFESVIWTVFAQPQYLSHRQMNKFREQLQMRPSAGGHHHKKRSLADPLPATRSARRRERRALKVLDELSFTPEERQRFRRDLTEKKQHAEALAAKMDEENAGDSHRTTLDAVHKAVDDHDDHDDHHDDDDDEGHLSEVEVEFLQEDLVNNFRPVQPLNGRLVYRSFKLRDFHGDQHPSSPSSSHHHGGHRQHHSGGGPHHAKSRDHLPDQETIRKRLEMYGEDSSAGSAAASVLLLGVSCLMSLLLLRL